MIQRAILYANAVSGVSYEYVPPLHASRIGDQVRLCLVSILKLSARRRRGQEYQATNLRTGNHWASVAKVTIFVRSRHIMVSTRTRPSRFSMRKQEVTQFHRRYGLFVRTISIALWRYGSRHPAIEHPGWEKSSPPRLVLMHPIQAWQLKLDFHFIRLLPEVGHPGLQ